MRFMLSLMCVLLLAACATDAGTGLLNEEKSVPERRNIINQMHDTALEDLYAIRPQARSEIRNAEGYAVFSNLGIQFFLVGGGGGRGVAIDRNTGERTYMSVATAGVGIGLGIRDFRAIFIFHSRSAFDYFIEEGWDFQGGADAAARIDNLGGAQIGEGANINRRVSVYQFTENGLALSASLNGTKYWRSSELNEYE